MDDADRHNKIISSRAIKVSLKTRGSYFKDLCEENIVAEFELGKFGLCNVRHGMAVLVNSHQQLFVTGKESEFRDLKIRKQVLLVVNWSSLMNFMKKWVN